MPIVIAMLSARRLAIKQQKKHLFLQRWGGQQIQLCVSTCFFHFPFARLFLTTKTEKITRLNCHSFHFTSARAEMCDNSKWHWHAMMSHARNCFVLTSLCKEHFILETIKEWSKQTKNKKSLKSFKSANSSAFARETSKEFTLSTITIIRFLQHKRCFLLSKQLPLHIHDNHTAIVSELICSLSHSLTLSHKKTRAE